MSEDLSATIFGWTVTGRSVALLGGLLAAATGAVGMTIDNAAGAVLGNTFVLGFVALTLVVRIVAGTARSIWRRGVPTASMTDSMWAIALLKIASLVAIPLLGLAVIGLLVIGNLHWRNFVQAIVLCMLLNVVLTFVLGIIGNFAAFRQSSRQPPSVPPA